MQVHPDDHAQPDQVDAKGFGRGDQEGHDDEGDFEEIQKAAQNEQDDIDDDQKANLTTRHRCQQMFDPDMAVDAVKRQRKHPRTNQDEHNKRRQPRGRGQRTLQHIQPQPPLGGCHDQRTDGPHGASLGGRGKADKDRAQHQKDQGQGRDQHHYHLLGKARHHIAASHLVGQRKGVDHADTDHGTQDISVGAPCIVEIQMCGVTDANNGRECHHQRGDAIAKGAHLGWQGRHPVGPEHRNQKNIKHVEANKDQAGDQRALVHIAHGTAQLISQHDQHKAGRDDLRQRARCCDHA